MTDGLFRTLLTHLGSIILALLLAVAVWIAATLQADPFAVQEFIGLSLVPVNQPQNTLLYQGDETNVSVTVRAPQSVLDNLDPSDLQVTIDLASAPVGAETSVPISVTVQDPGVRILSYAPTAQKVRLEALGAVTLPVAIELTGEVPIGYQAGSPAVQPAEVQVFGPLPALRQVVSVTGSLDLGRARDDISQQVTVVPRGAGGTAVTGIEWEPNQVQVDVAVRRRVGYKPEVEVVPDLRGDPAPGYRRGSVSVEPATVTLAGPTSVLSGLPGFVKTLPISITAATENLSLRAPLTVPNSVVVVETNFVTISVEILPILGSRTLTSTVEIQGLRRGLRASLSPASVEVILEGPATLLEQLDADSVQVFVDLAGYSVGMHRVDPIVLHPPNVRVVSVIPETIEISIDVAPAATPTPGATATP